MNTGFRFQPGVSAGGSQQEPFSLHSSQIAAMLPARHVRSNKGSYGKALLAAGSRNMAGAALLSAQAAYRTGCGLVMICSPEENRNILQSTLPEALYHPLDEQTGVPFSFRASAAGAGPGIGMSAGMKKTLYSFLDRYHGPVVLDADALNLLAEDLHSLDPSVVQAALDRIGGREAVLTPHPGEMSRLLGCRIQDVLADPAGAAVKLAASCRVICVMKDHETVITDGRRVCINHTGCDGMATGGSGDVLTGIITGLAAQGMSPFDAAAAGVWIHGRAGEAAAAELGVRSMLAGDIIRFLPQVFLELDNGPKSYAQL